MDAEDFELGLRVLENLDYPAPPRLHNFISYAKRNGKDPAMSQLAGFIVTRLNNNRQKYWHLGVKPREEIKTLALGIRRLPAAHLLPHKEAMIAVASRPDVQLYGYSALQRLAVFGDDAVPTLLPPPTLCVPVAIFST